MNKFVFISVLIIATSLTVFAKNEFSNTTLIYTNQDLYDYRELVNQGITNQNAELKNDLHLEKSEWQAISNHTDIAFSGTFDGNGYTIFNLFSSENIDNQAFIAFNNGTIKNLALEGEFLNLGTYSAGFSSENNGLIENCHNYISIDSDSNFLAGIAAYNKNKIIQSSNNAIVSSENYLAGIASINDGEIISSANKADIIAKNIRRASAAGIAYECNYDAKIIYTYNLGNISVNARNGNAAGLVANFLLANDIQISNSYNAGLLNSPFNFDLFDLSATNVSNNNNYYLADEDDFENSKISLDSMKSNIFLDLINNNEQLIIDDKYKLVFNSNDFPSFYWEKSEDKYLSKITFQGDFNPYATIDVKAFDNQNNAYEGKLYYQWFLLDDDDFILIENESSPSLFINEGFLGKKIKVTVSDNNNSLDLISPLIEKTGEQSLLEEDYNNLDIPELIGENVVSDFITLSYQGENESKIVWTSSNSQIINQYGFVNNPEEKSEKIILNANLSLSKSSINKKFTLKVYSVEEEETFKKIYSSSNELIKNKLDLSENKNLLESLENYYEKTAVPDNKIEILSKDEKYIDGENNAIYLKKHPKDINNYDELFEESTILFNIENGETLEEYEIDLIIPWDESFGKEVLKSEILDEINADELKNNNQNLDSIKSELELKNSFGWAELSWVSSNNELLEIVEDKGKFFTIVKKDAIDKEIMLKLIARYYIEKDKQKFLLIEDNKNFRLIILADKIEIIEEEKTQAGYTAVEESNKEFDEKALKEKTLVENISIDKKNNETVFKDLSENHWASKYILELYELGIILGFEDNVFMPENHIKRSEFVTLIYKISDKKINKIVENNFSDLSESDWYYKAIFWGYSNDILTGRSKNIFDPNSYITRADASLMIKNYLEYSHFAFDENLSSYDFIDENDFPDYAKNAIDLLSSNKILNGYEDGSFKANNYIKRSESAKIIWDILNLEK